MNSEKLPPGVVNNTDLFSSHVPNFDCGWSWNWRNSGSRIHYLHNRLSRYDFFDIRLCVSVLILTPDDLIATISALTLSIRVIGGGLCPKKLVVMFIH
jgi:hypothetical protein